jgi:4-hydroxybenzoate polyprenyltransferase
MSASRASLSQQQIIIQTAIYLIGCTLRHNAACIWNDICDRDFDRQVGESLSWAFVCDNHSLTIL